jgi:hypothetical protein
VEVLRAAPIRDPSGRAFFILKERLGDECPVGDGGLRGAVFDLDQAGVIVREIRGKRTFAIELLEDEPVSDDDVSLADPDRLRPDIPRLEEEAEHVRPTPDLGVDVDELARALLAEVMSVWSRPHETQQTQQRMGQLLEDNQVLRKRAAQLQEDKVQLQDRTNALNNEVRGLRQRVQTAEANTQAALAKNGRVVDEEVRKQLARFMQERPGTSR